MDNYSEAEARIGQSSDSFLALLTKYSDELNYQAISPDAVHAAKVRIIDTLGALLGGYFGEPCRINRDIAALSPDPNGASILGTRMKAAPDIAAFVNSTTARYVETSDVFRKPGASGGHPSDMLMSILAAAEHSKANGREYIAASVLAYEIFCGLSEAIGSWGHSEPTNYASLGVAAASAKLFCLPSSKISHAISMAAVSSYILREVRSGDLSMWKAIAAGSAGRSGVFSAMLARAGIEGPLMPFQGKHGWFRYVSGKSVNLGPMGGNGHPFKIEMTMIKPRTSCAATISSLLAAEKVAATLNGAIDGIKKVIVEVYQDAKNGMGTAAHHWNPQSRESADHSIPYVVAATLKVGTVTPRQFNEAHIWNPEIRALLPKIEVIANDEFSAAYNRVPVQHCTRVTALMADGSKVVGESGGDKGDLANPKSDAEIEQKFMSLAEDYFGARRVRAMLDRLWNIEEENMADVPTMLVFS